ncbi:FAD dependent oxidoreductase [Neohortaea acidophila]|uniref:FAD dependent oxidoreductase n=1 Tax=Neohortaea acidophila TaxID=245834 RepID=A0A6A6PM01_9PEZI|nr:FAD dependent oxidoreductase [Neohortaea acidophila]KAF2480846.1 FAD dependent oxidoreductase [Neohortaea acidophila]
MGGSTTTYPGFPVPNPTTSYWQLPPHRIANHRTTPNLPTTTTFDYIIIGSGISGAATAYKLLRRNPSTSILMLEARSAASGASGRNGGHCRAGWWTNFKKYAEAFGEEEALKFEALEEGNVRDIAAFVREHEVECDFRAVETADLAATEAVWEEAMEVVRFREDVRRRRPDAGDLSSERKFWVGEEARERFGIEALVGAITYPGHTQNPYRLVCRMLELSLDMGLNLQTNTLVTDVSPSTTPDGARQWNVRTERGTAQGRQVVLATNAYTNALHRSLGATGFLTPSRSQVTALRPGSNATGNPALRGSAGIDDFEAGGYFFAREPGLQGEGDIIWGGGRPVSKTREMGITDDSTVHAGIAEYLHHAPGHLFGEKAWGTEGEVLRDWTGIVCYTPDTFPLVGEAPGEEGLWMSVAMNGHGSK